MLYPLSYERKSWFGNKAFQNFWVLIAHQQLKSYSLRRRRDLNPRGGFIPLPLSRRVPWTGLGDASQNFLEVSCRNSTLLIAFLCISLRAEGVGFEPTRSVNPFRFSRPVPSATRRALREISFHQRFLTQLPVQSN